MADLARSPASIFEKYRELKFEQRKPTEHVGQLVDDMKAMYFADDEATAGGVNLLVEGDKQPVGQSAFWTTSATASPGTGAFQAGSHMTRYDVHSQAPNNDSARPRTPYGATSFILNDLAPV